MFGKIYKIINKLDGKVYVGQTVSSLQKRWREHCSAHSECRYVSRAIIKYGKENFEIKVLAHCNSIEEMNHREQYYIKLFNTLAPSGYNLTSGGSERKFSLETRARISKSNSGVNNGFFGKNHTKETKLKLSELANKRPPPFLDRKHSDETKIRIGLAHKGKTESEETKRKKSVSKKGDRNNFFGQKHSALTKAKISAKISRPIYCPELDRSFPSIKSASEQLGIWPVQIGQILKNKVNGHKGLTFKYFD